MEYIIGLDSVFGCRRRYREVSAKIKAESWAITRRSSGQQLCTTKYKGTLKEEAEGKQLYTCHFTRINHISVVDHKGIVPQASLLEASTTRGFRYPVFVVWGYDSVTATHN